MLCGDTWAQHNIQACWITLLYPKLMCHHVSTILKHVFQKERELKQRLLKEPCHYGGRDGQRVPSGATDPGARVGNETREPNRGAVWMETDSWLTSQVGCWIHASERGFVKEDNSPLEFTHFPWLEQLQAHEVLPLTDSHWILTTR